MEATAPAVQKPPAADEALSSSACERRILIRWMTSGDAACAVQSKPGTCAFDLKVQVQAALGVPIAEQRLFLDDAELSGPGCVPAAALSLQLLRDGDVRNTNLAHFRVGLKLEPSIPGELKVVKRLADAINGTVSLYRWRREGREDECVAVKKMPNSKVNQNLGRETNGWHAHLSWQNAPSHEDSLTEIGVLSYLSRQADLPLYFLKMRAAFADDRSTWLLTEFANGGALFSHVASAPVPIAEAHIRRYTWQLLQAVAYLHAHGIGHRDISLENVLLKDGTVRLMDFGMAVQTHSPSGVPLRYFQIPGKDNYRPPECYLPPCKTVQARAPRCADPGDVALVATAGGYLCEVRLPADAVAGQACTAELWGYAVPPVDVFSSGICLFILAFQIPLWRRALLSDPHFSYVHSVGERGIEMLLKHWDMKPRLSSEGMRLLTGMLQTQPSKRMTLNECLASPWFDALAGSPVPLHAPPT